MDNASRQAWSLSFCHNRLGSQSPHALLDQIQDTERAGAHRRVVFQKVLLPRIAWCSKLRTLFWGLFFCSRDCCLCAMHQSVKERRHAKKQNHNRETRPNQAKTKTPTKKTQHNQKHHNHKKPLQRVKRVRRRSHRTGET